MSSEHLIDKIEFDKDKKAVFRSFNHIDKAEVLLIASDKLKAELLSYLNKKELLDLFEHLDHDEITDLLQIMSPNKRNKILEGLKKNLRKKVKFLLRFTPHSAAGLMDLNYLIIKKGTPKTEIIKRVKHHLSQGLREPNLLILDHNEKLLGELRLSKVFFFKSKEMYSNLKELPVVVYNQDQEECLELFNKHSREKLIVLGDDGAILGIIRSSDMLKVIEEEDTEDFYQFAGLDKEEQINDGISQKVRFRLNWLVLNLLTAFLAAFVVSMFENTISKIVLLAAFMPIVAGMGGNAGTQTTAIVLRGLALNKIESENIQRILRSEVFASIFNGLVVGVLVGISAIMFGESWLFGVVAGLAVLLNLVVGAFFGAIIPIILEKRGFDPASSSGVFVSTATDVFGFFIFLGLATLILL